MRADDITLRRLVVAKRIFQFALSQQAPPSSTTSRILAIVALDLSAETVLKAICLSLDPTRTPSDSFAGLLAQVDQLLAQRQLPELPAKAHLLHVHSLRNDVQHKAKTVSAEEVSDSRTYTRDFLGEAVRGVWDVSFDEISMADLVRDEEVRGALRDAESAFQEERWLASAENAVTGLYWALERVRSSIVGRTPFTIRGLVVEDAFKKTKSERSAWEAIQRTQDTVLYLALGMDYSSLLKCTERVGRPEFTLDGKAHFVRREEAPQLDRVEAEFVLGYAAQAVVEIESRVGDLSAPFGREYWW